MKNVLRTLLGIELAFVLFLLTLPMAADACGCGIFIPREGSVGITQERAIIRWDGQTEDIVMALQVQGDAKEAAWIMPVPSPAQVKLGDPQMFDFLQDFTKPREEIVYDWFPVLETVGGALPGSAVTLLDRREIGVYDVSTLAANDAQALNTWLNANGYRFPTNASQVFQSYVDQKWYYIAARISPSKASSVKGELDPLWMTFKSDRAIYPMKPSSLARGPMGVYLYFLTDHRMNVPGLDTNFAGWIAPTDVPADHSIRQVVDHKYFLTKLQKMIYTPATQITDDYIASPVPDNQVRQVVYKHVSVYNSPLFWTVICGGLVAIVLATIGLFVWVLRRTGRKNNFKAAQ